MNKTIWWFSSYRYIDMDCTAQIQKYEYRNQPCFTKHSRWSSALIKWQLSCVRCTLAPISMFNSLSPSSSYIFVLSYWRLLIVFFPFLYWHHTCKQASQAPAMLKRLMFWKKISTKCITIFGCFINERTLVCFIPETHMNAENVLHILSIKHMFLCCYDEKLPANCSNLNCYAAPTLLGCFLLLFWISHSCPSCSSMPSLLSNFHRLLKQVYCDLSLNACSAFINEPLLSSALLKHFSWHHCCINQQTWWFFQKVSFFEWRGDVVAGEERSFITQIDNMTIRIAYSRV